MQNASGMLLHVLYLYMLRVDCTKMRMSVRYRAQCDGWIDMEDAGKVSVVVIIVIVLTISILLFKKSSIT